PVADVDLAALERGQSGGRIRDRLEDQPLDVRGLSPVLVHGLEHELDARRERDEPIGTGADRVLLEALVADLRDVALRDDPSRPGRARVERKEIGPRLLQAEADARRTHASS